MTTTVDRPNKDALNKAIDIYRDAMRPFIVRNIRRVPAQRVEDVIYRSLNNYQASRFQRNMTENQGNVEAAIDVGDFPELIGGNWRGVFNSNFPSREKVHSGSFRGSGNRVIRRHIRIQLTLIIESHKETNARLASGHVKVELQPSLEQRNEVNEIFNERSLDPNQPIESIV